MLQCHKLTVIKAKGNHAQTVEKMNAMLFTFFVCFRFNIFFFATNSEM